MSDETKKDHVVPPTWIMWGARALLVTFLLGLIPFLREVYDDIKDLYAKDGVKAEKIITLDKRVDKNEAQVAKMYDKIDALYYQFIQRRGIVVPPPEKRK